MPKTGADDHCGQRHYSAVGDQRREVRAGPDGHVVLERDALRQVLHLRGDDVLLGLQRHQERPKDREDGEGHDGQDGNVGQGVGEPLPRSDTGQVAGHGQSFITLERRT